MADKAFEVAIAISVVDKVSRGITSVLRSFDMLGKAEENIKKTSASATVAQAKIDQLYQTFDKFRGLTAAGAAITGVGIAMGSAVMDGVNKAAEMEMSMTSLKISSGATVDQMKELRDVISDIAVATIYDDKEVAKITQMLSAGGITDISQLKSSSKHFTNLAEVTQLQTNGQIKPEQTVNAALGMAHQFAIYDDAGLAKFNDLLAKIQLTTTAKIPSLAKSMKYVAPYANLIGATPEDTLTGVALLSRMGIDDSMAGTHLKNFYNRLTPGSMRSGGATTEMYELGWLKNPKTHTTNQGNVKVDSWSGDIMHDDQGKVLPLKDIINNLITTSQGKTYSQLLVPFKSIFGERGADVAAIFSSRIGRDQMKNIINSTSKMPGLDEQIKMYRQDTYQGAMERLTGTLQSLKLYGFDPLKESMKPVINFLADMAEKLQKFAQSHPQVMAFISKFIAGTTLLMLVVGPILTVIGTVGMLTTVLGAMGVTIGGVMAAGAAAILPILAVIAIVIAAIVAVVEAVKHWDTIKLFAKFVVTWISEMVTAVKTFIGNFINSAFEWGKALITTFVDGIKSLAMAPVNAVKDIVQKVRDHLPGSDAKTGPLSTLTKSGRALMTTLAKGAKMEQGVVRGVLDSEFQSPVNAKLLSRNNGAGAIDNSTIFSEGAIQIIQQPGQDAKELAREVYKEFQTMLRDERRRSGVTLANAF